jgi:hypothetical protein
VVVVVVAAAVVAFAVHFLSLISLATLHEIKVPSSDAQPKYKDHKFRHQ